MKQFVSIFGAVLCLAALLPQGAFAEEMTGMSAAEIVDQMGIGWNLGNTFDATGGEPDDIYSQEQSWGNPIVDEALIKRVHDAGFTTIRIPVTWYRHVSNDGSYTIDPAFLNRIREVVDLCYDEGVFVILNMHHEEWLNVATLDQDFEKIGVQLTAMWHQIADAFAEYDQHLIFESMNEPRMAGTSIEWTGNQAGSNAVNYLNQVFVDTIRTDAKGYNGERALIIPGYAASSSTSLLRAITIPTFNGEQAENIVISVHCYNPYDFCLSDKMTDFDPTNKQHTSSIDTVFSNLQRLFLDKGIPVVMGETSATNTQNNTEAREKWAYYMGAKSSAYGIPICMWDNGHNNTSGGECHPWVRRSQNSKLRSQKNPLPYPTVVENLFAGAASIEWATGRDTTAPVKSRLSGTVLWSNDAGLQLNKAIQLKSMVAWYAAGRQFALVYTGEGSVHLQLTPFGSNTPIVIAPSTVNPVGQYTVAWFPYEAVMAACADVPVDSLEQFEIVLTDGSITAYELCYVGK